MNNVGSVAQTMKPVQSFLADLRSNNNRLLATNNELESAIYRLSGVVPPHDPQPGSTLGEGKDKLSLMDEGRQLAAAYEINLIRYGMLVEALNSVL